MTKLSAIERDVFSAWEGTAVDCCEVIGGPCYYDGSSLNAERLIQPFLEGGSDAVWRELEEYYHETFPTDTPDPRVFAGMGRAGE